MQTNPTKNFNDPGVVLYVDSGDEPCAHERQVHLDTARRLATIKGFEFAGEYSNGASYSHALYFVPLRTLLHDEARRLGIRGPEDLFGGVVPFSILATKVISHPLIRANAAAPDGWSHEFPDAVRQVTLPGVSAFTHEDAAHAGDRMLADGPVRLKPARAVGGRGQRVASTAAELDAALAAMDDTELFEDGVVVEQNLRKVTTFSVGQVRVGDLVTSYYGTQRLTRDHQDVEVYGGSDLVLVRGGYEELLTTVISEQVRLAIEQARVYDDAASKHIPGFIASRRNYDVAQGFDASGEIRSGVLEQSWRIGGATTAEVAALEAFRADQELRSVESSCVEKYGLVEVPPDAILQFRGIDDRVGEITRYTRVKPHGRRTTDRRCDR